MKINQNQPITSRTDFFYLFFRNFLLIGLPLLILSALALTNSYSRAVGDNSSADNISIDLPVSCTMAGSGNTHSESLINGKYDNNIGNGVTKLTTYCNDQGGYVIYATGSSDNTEGNTNLVGNNGEFIATGTATSGDTSNWAFKISALDNSLTMNSNYTSDFASIPATWTEIAKKESGTVNSSTGSSITATYAVYVNGTQGAGTYSGRVKYAMLHPSTMNAPTTLERAFLLAGKQKITIYDDGSGVITEKATNETTGEPNALIGSYYKMQDMTTNICNTTNITGEASQLQLLDIRDYKTYWVTKLVDSHCWMTQNLALDLDSTTTVGSTNALTSENTDLNRIAYTESGITYYGEYGGTGYVCKNKTNPATITAQDCSGDNEVITWLPSISTVNSSMQWNDNNNDPRSLSSSDSYTKTDIGDHGLTGNYYNWSATIASNDSSALNTDNITGENREAENSVCPKGWRLPRIRKYIFNNVGENDFANLNFYYNGGKTNTATNLIDNPLYFLQSGVLYGTNIAGVNSLGSYWSSTVASATNAYRLNFANNYIKPADTDGRRTGFSVRCLAR